MITEPAAHPSLTSHNNKLSVAVPWDRADDLQWYLRNRGISTTACLDPLEHAAWLDLWPHVDVQQVEAALREWIE